MKWISVKDKLPQYNTYVLVLFDATCNGTPYECCNAKLREDDNWVHLGNDRVEDIYCYAPTHWMPLPTPPTSDNSSYETTQSEIA